MKNLQLNECPKCTTLRVKNTPVSMLCPLHAAAPELLEACQTLLARFYLIVKTLPVKQQADAKATINQAADTIAKAEGVTL
jgi:hypothetical protein